MSKDLLMFIHGLGGHPQKTWGAFPDLVGKDPQLGQYEVDFFSYPTSLFRFPFSKKYPKIQTLAKALRTQIGTVHQDKENIFLVCHSLGGLIARRYLIDEFLEKTELKVRLLLLYAVPSNGSALAEVGSLMSRHNQLRQLCRDSDIIRDINAFWHSLDINEHITTKHIVAAQDRVVSEHSASEFFGNPNVEVIPFGGHAEIVKPESSADLRFLLLKRFVLESHPAANAPGLGSDEIDLILKKDTITAEEARTVEAYLDGPVPDEDRWDIIRQMGQPGCANAVSLLADTARKSSDYNSRYEAVVALGKIGEPARTTLLELLGHAEASVRYTAVKGLGSLRPDPASIGRIRNVLVDDVDSIVKSNAVEALVSLGAIEAMEDILATMCDGPEVVRMTAARALRRVNTPAVREALRRTARHDPAYRPRLFATQSLAEIGDKDALPVLDYLRTKDKTELVRKAAEEAYFRLSSQ